MGLLLGLGVGGLLEGLNRCLRFNGGHGRRPVGALIPVPAGHANVRALQMVQRDCIGRFSAQRAADLRERELGGRLELEMAEAECCIKQPRQDR
jgi:hypothetical protein